MRARSSWRGLLLASALVRGAVGCAVAADDVDGVTPRADGSADTRRNDGSAPEDTSAPEDSTSATADSGSTASKDSSTPTTDTGSAATDTGSGATDTGPSGTKCTSLGSAECAGSFTDLGSVSGDKGANVKTASGSDSQWFHVRVTEDDASLLSSVDLRARITLAPSAGNFDLYVYKGKTVADGGGIECSTVYLSSTNPTGDDVLSAKWNDNRPIGGSDDTRTLSIEVRATDAICTGASWTLKVEGNK